ncbi:MAG: YraN family protein [Candidatus Krumholzibacteria bacterium]|nr:YraN family protein [Candidatus Krumholzibacteria bacterium]
MDGTSVGKSGENIAEEYLRLSEFTILERNYRVAGLEVDIIATDGDCLVFIEVKTRRTSTFGDAIDAIHPGKMARIRKAARHYISTGTAKRSYDEIRFDVVAIDHSLMRGEMLLRHIRGVI